MSTIKVNFSSKHDLATEIVSEICRCYENGRLDGNIGIDSDGDLISTLNKSELEIIFSRDGEWSFGDFGPGDYHSPEFWSEETIDTLVESFENMWIGEAERESSLKIIYARD